MSNKERICILPILWIESQYAKFHPRMSILNSEVYFYVNAQRLDQNFLYNLIRPTSLHNYNSQLFFLNHFWTTQLNLANIFPLGPNFSNISSFFIFLPSSLFTSPPNKFPLYVCKARYYDIVILRQFEYRILIIKT